MTWHAAVVAIDPVERLRGLCLALPETNERLTHGEPGFFIRDKKLFVMVDQHHHGADRLAFWCAAPPGGQAELIAEDSERFFVPPYVGPRGWLGMRIDNDPDWHEVNEVVREAYRHVAPKTLAARLDAWHS